MAETMDNADRAFLAFLFVLWTVGWGGCGLSVGTSAQRDQAIEAGVGRWCVDERTGERRFVYGARP